MRQAEGYVATEVQNELVDASGDGQYRVRDFWSGHREFEVFRERVSEGFVRFDRDIVEGLVEKQEFVGAYYEADQDLS